MSGIYTLGLVLLALLLSAEAVKTKRGCPRPQAKFERQLDRCYKVLFYSSYDPDIPEDFCGMYKNVVNCVQGWVDRCSHRSWLDETRQEEIEDRLRGYRHSLDTECAGYL